MPISSKRKQELTAWEDPEDDLDLTFLSAFEDGLGDGGFEEGPKIEEQDGVDDPSPSPPNTDESILEGSVRAMLAKDLIKNKNLDDALRVMGVDERLGMKKPATGGTRTKAVRTTAMSAEEKQALSRQRNRENARATRKRRKVYVQRLQQLITDLSSNLTAMQRAAAAKREQEEASGVKNEEGDGSADEESKKRAIEQMNAARCAVVQRFFEFRSNGVTDKEEWSKLISNDKSFVLTLPPLPFRKYEDFEKSGQFYRCRGIDGLIADTAVVETAMARIAATRGKMGPNTKCTCTATYTADPKDMLVGMDKLMCKWQAIFNFDIDGKKLKMQISGMCKCRFTLDNLLASVDLRYDVQGLIQQLERVMPPSCFPVMPMAMPSFPNANAKTSKTSNSPKPIVAAAALAPAGPVAPAPIAPAKKGQSKSVSPPATTDNRSPPPLC